MSQHKKMQAQAVRMLKLDHKRVLDLFFHFEQSEHPSHKLSFAETAMNEIAVHSVIEEECVYPLLEKESKKLGKLIAESRSEHAELDELMSDLVNRKQYDANYHEKFSKFAKLVKHHIEEEERDLFDHLNKRADDALAQRMNDLKNDLLKYDSVTDSGFSPQVLLFERLRDRRRSA